jgi:hypothetical protein
MERRQCTAKPEGNGRRGVALKSIAYPLGDAPSVYTSVLPARFLSKVVADEATGCWLWTRSLTRIGGYGRFGRGTRDEGWTTAHRYAWEQIVGPIPRGMELDHLCRRGACCNPAHIQAVTHAENLSRGLTTNGGGLCRRGVHAWVGENILIERGGAKRCRACRNAWYRADRREGSQRHA